MNNTKPQAGFRGIMSSGFFTFFIGENKAKFVVHSAAFSKLSPAIDRMMNGDMKEAQEKCVTWEDVDEYTFETLCEFAYTDDYAQLQQKSSRPIWLRACEIKGRETPDIVKVLRDMRNTSRRPRTKCDHRQYSLRSRPLTSRQLSHRRVFKGSEVRLAGSNLDFVKARASDFLWQLYDPREDYPFYRCSDHDKTDGETRCAVSLSRVFLHDARLYVLADKWGINQLQDLITGKFQDIFRLCELKDKRIDDVIELVRLIYSDNFQVHNDGLRKLVVFYVASSMRILTKEEEFVELWEEGGRFADDVWERICTELAMTH